jgi:acyl-CoA dehydrogenase
MKPPTDGLGARVAGSILEDGAQRLSLSADIYIPPADEPGLGRLEAALDKSVEARPIRDKLRQAVRAGTLDKAGEGELADAALAQGVIDAGERRVLREFQEIRTDVIQVDVFEAEEYRSLKG